MARARLKPCLSSFKSPAWAASPLALCGYLGRGSLHWLQRRLSRWVDQIAFAGRLILAGLYGDQRQKGRALLTRRLFLHETWLLFRTTGSLMIIVGLLVGFLWDAIWFGPLNNIGGAPSLISLAFSIQLQEVAPILGAAVITMGHGVPMTVDLALRKGQGEFQTLTFLGVPPEHFLAWPRLLGGLVGFPVLYLTLAIFTLLGLFVGIHLTIGLSVGDFLATAHAALVEFKFLKMAAKCLLVGFCLNFFCLYRSWQTEVGDIRSIPACARWATAETFVHSTFCAVVVTILYD